MNKAAGRVLRVLFFKSKFFKRSRIFPDVVMETVSVVFLVGNVLDLAEFFNIILTEGIRQGFGWRGVNAEMVAVLFSYRYFTIETVKSWAS